MINRISKPEDHFEEVYSTYPVGTTRTKEMLRYFFMLGYIHAGDQAADLMGRYACGVAGCDAMLYKPEDIYDGVEEELINFFKEQVGESND
jgi:hypothetical protein